MKPLSTAQIDDSRQLLCLDIVRQRAMPGAYRTPGACGDKGSREARPRSEGTKKKVEKSDSRDGGGQTVPSGSKRGRGRGRRRGGRDDNTRAATLTTPQTCNRRKIFWKNSSYRRPRHRMDAVACRRRVAGGNEASCRSRSASARRRRLASAPQRVCSAQNSQGPRYPGGRSCLSVSRASARSVTGEVESVRRRM